MIPNKVHIDKIKLILLITEVFETAQIFKDLTNGNGEIEVDFEDYPNFSRDIGIILAKCIQKSSRFSD